jgi:hypothetical protein
MYYINKEGTSFSFIENTTRKIYRDFCFVYVLDNDTRQFHVEKGLLIESFDTREEADLFISWITDCFQFNTMPATYEVFQKVRKKELDKIKKEKK